MKLTYFISGSSILLLGWLAMTFVRHVPSPRYQKSGNLPVESVVPSRAELDHGGGDAAAGVILPISSSH